MGKRPTNWYTFAKNYDQHDIGRENRVLTFQNAGQGNPKICRQIGDRNAQGIQLVRKRQHRLGYFIPSQHQCRTAEEGWNNLFQRDTETERCKLQNRVVGRQAKMRYNHIGMCRQ